MPGTNDVFSLTVISSNATCVGYTAPLASDRGFPWWAGLILGLGLAFILCMAAAGLLLWLRRRKRRRADATAAKTLPQHSMQTVINPMQLASPFNVGPLARTGMGVPDDSAIIVPPKFTSAPGDGNSGKPPLERQGMASAPQHVYKANMKINAMPMSGAVLPGSNPEDGQGGQRSSGYDKTSASSSIGSQRMGKSSAGAPAVDVPELFRQRSHMPLDEVSTYKIVTVNANRQMVVAARSSSQGTSQQPRLPSHPEASAAVEKTVLDDELHQVDGPDEMQTWMLLEVSAFQSVRYHCRLRATY
ncbi:hypothetical protein ABBQ38_006225 [Trebouxia sp. C0009 RCD-2024]